jgi:hypothetical protein
MATSHKILRRIKNTSSVKVDCFWVTGEGTEVFYQSLTVSEIYSSITFDDHRWNVRMHPSAVLLSYSEQISSSFDLDVSFVVDCKVNEPTQLQYALNDLMTKNNIESFWKSKETINRILLNIIQEPNNQKFKCLKASNQKIKQTIIDMKGAVDFLLACGFSTKRENDDFLLEFQSEDVEKLKKAGDLLTNESATFSKRQSNPLKYDGKTTDVPCCDECKKQIDDGKESLNSAWLIASGEFRYECEYCKHCLCGDCFDKYRKSEDFLRKEKQEKRKCDHNFQPIKPKSRGWDWTQGLESFIRLLCLGGFV